MSRVGSRQSESVPPKRYEVHINPITGEPTYFSARPSTKKDQSGYNLYGRHFITKTPIPKSSKVHDISVSDYPYASKSMNSSIIESPELDGEEGEIPENPDDFEHENIEKWDEYFNKQLEFEKKQYEEEKREELLRARKYKEALDQLVHDERERRAKHSPTKYSPSPVPRGESREILERIYRLQEINKEEDKAQRMNILQKVMEDKSTQELNRKKQADIEKKEYNRYLNFLKHLDDEITTQERMNQQRALEEYKKHLEHAQIAKAQKKKAEMEEERKFKEQELQIMLDKERERKEFYEKIRGRIYKNHESFNEYQKKQKQKDRSIDEIIEKNAIEKHRHDYLEMKKRKDDHFQRERDALQMNINQIRAKKLKNKIEQAQNQLECDEVKRHIETNKIIDSAEKEVKYTKMKDYERELKDQLKLVEEKKHQQDYLSKNERVINFRSSASPQKDADFSRSALPVGKGYERRLQLSYVDNCLYENPKDPYKSKKPKARLRVESGLSVIQDKLRDYLNPYEYDRNH